MRDAWIPHVRLGVLRGWLGDDGGYRFSFLVGWPGMGRICDVAHGCTPRHSILRGRTVGPSPGNTLMKLIVVLATSLYLSASAVAAERPNVVYVLADQWRASATGYAGDPNVKTPNLDRLAKSCLNFRNVVSVAPVCTPYRAALMTGRYPTSTGMFLNDAHLPDSELCMAEMYRAAGYKTGYIGKWHLDGHGRGSYIPPERRQGWDYWKAAECDHNYNHSHYYTGDSDEKRFWEGYDAFAQTKDAQQYLREQASGEQPFLLFVSYGTPHFPHDTAPAEFKALYPPEKIQLPPNVPPDMQAAGAKEAQGYYAHCTALDQCIGELLATLDETRLAANTIFVFTSDHGEMLGSHGARPYFKQVAWNESAHVPFLLRYPAMHGEQGREVRTPLTTPDILPTLLGLAGLEIPPTIEGQDLSPLIREGREADDRAALYMGVAPFMPREFAREYRAIRTSRYTYVRNLDGPWMLFDDEQDPHQMDNLVGKPGTRGAGPATRCAAASRADAYRRRLPPGPSYIAEWGYQIGSHGSVPYNEPDVKPQTPRR